MRVWGSALRYLVAPAGYFAAIISHFLHNLMASADNELLCLFQLGVNWTGYIALLFFMIWLVWRERHVMRRQLAEELNNGLITSLEYQTACSIPGQLSARIAAIGRRDHPGKLFDLLGQLQASFSDPNWSAPTTLFTGFAFTGLIYFAFCFGMSRYSLFVENRLNAHRRN